MAMTYRIDQEGREPIAQRNPDNMDYEIRIPLRSIDGGGYLMLRFFTEGQANTAKDILMDAVTALELLR